MVAQNFADMRDVCFEGPAGLLAVIPRPCILSWQRSFGQLILYNGTIIQGYSAEKPAKLRGPQHHRAWVDEFAFWERPDTLLQLQFGLRLGFHPQLIITTTPSSIPELKAMLDDKEYLVTSGGSTFENEANLAKPFLKSLIRRFEGTRIGRQELYAELLTDVEGALWNRELLDKGRVAKGTLPDLKQIVVAIDPAVTSGAKSDETGIMVVGLGVDDHGYILQDLSGTYSPEQWARQAVAAYHHWGADKIVAEDNNGGEMVEHTIKVLRNSAGRRIGLDVPVKRRHASRGKAARAEPVVSLYEQDRVHHVGSLPDLEDQLCSWKRLGREESPDRLDALVWGVTEIMLYQVEWDIY